VKKNLIIDTSYVPEWMKEEIYMDIGYLTSDAMKYPSKDFKKIIILGLLIMISFLIFPAFMVMGYVFRVIKWSIAGVEELPDFDEWGELFIDGLKIFVVELVYFLVPSLIMFLGIWASIGSFISLSNSESTLAPAAVYSAFSVMSGLIILGMVVAIIFGVFFIIGVANMAYYNGELGAAFRFREIIDIIKAIGWVDFIIWYVMMILVAMAAGFIATFIGLMPILGWLVIILVIYPYLYLLYARAVGLLFVSGLEAL
jgi:hypothetical protein